MILKVRKQRREAAQRFLTARQHLSLMSPLFNLREIAKQMLLLEDHLLHVNKHCHDCIRKHLLTIEAFAEEATTLDKDQEYVVLSEHLAFAARSWMEAVCDGEDFHTVAQQIRGVRKQLVSRVHDTRLPASRVASVYQHRNRHFCKS